MNKRQDIATWVLGIALALVSSYNGERHSDWMFGAFVPILIVGTLIVYSLRTRTPEQPASAAILKGGVGLVLAVSLLAYLEQRNQRVAWEADEARTEAESAKHQVDEVQSTVSELESKVRGLEIDAIYRR